MPFVTGNLWTIPSLQSSAYPTVNPGWRPGITQVWKASGRLIPCCCSGECACEVTIAQAANPPILVKDNDSDLRKPSLTAEMSTTSSQIEPLGNRIKLFLHQNWLANKASSQSNAATLWPLTVEKAVVLTGNWPNGKNWVWWVWAAVANAKPKSIKRTLNKLTASQILMEKQSTCVIRMKSWGENSLETQWMPCFFIIINKSDMWKEMNYVIKKFSYTMIAYIV